MRKSNFGIPILGALALTTGLFGCADENHWGSSSNEKGSISLTLSTDSGIKTAKPVFRSEGDSESTPDPNNLNTYINMPKPEDFSIRLEKSDESFSKTWTSLKGFLNYTKENFFSTGAYTLTAFYGEKGKQDFNSPYFEASTTFNVLSDQVYEVDLVAELKNSMVKVNYTDGFRDYMSDFHSSLHTEGRTNDIIFSKDETDIAFIEPNSATLNLHMTTKDKNYTTDLEIGKFAPFAKTLHNITLDIVENENGTGQLQLIFDDKLDEEIVKIDLTDELYTTDAPSILCKGFEDGQTIEILEKSACPDNLRMEAFVPGILASAVLTFESSTNPPSWGYEIDLCSASQEQKNDIKAVFGEEAVRNIGFDGVLQDVDVAVLDLSNIGSSLLPGIHKISLKVTDKYGRTSNTASLTLDSKPVELEVIGTPTIGYCAKSSRVTINYNGEDPLKDLEFKTTTDQANSAVIKVVSCEEPTATRSVETKQYVIELELPDNVTAAREKIAVDICHNGTKKQSFDIKVDVPEYNLEYDAFAKHAFVKVNIPESNDPNLLSDVVANMTLLLNDEYKTTGVLNFTEEGYLLVNDLAPNTEYVISSTITKGDIINKHASMTTEVAKAVPNGDFSTPGQKLESNTLQVGGQYSVSPVNYALKSKFSYDEPAGWATVNSLTAWSGSKNKNTWFIVPSSYLYEEQGLMRSVGYNHDGTTPNKSGGAFNTKYYCENSPSDAQLNKAAGELFLGSFNFDGSVSSREEGIAFASRPSSISFEYSYEPINNDIGYAKIELIDVDGNPLGSEPKIFNLVKGENRKESISFEYNPFGKKAAKLVISFKSSNLPVPPIQIPTGAQLDEGFKMVGNHTVDTNKYKAVAIGSVLKIDNVKAHYGDEDDPSKAPKRTTNKKR